MFNDKFECFTIFELKSFYGKDYALCLHFESMIKKCLIHRTILMCFIRLALSSFMCIYNFASTWGEA